MPRSISHTFHSILKRHGYFSLIFPLLPLVPKAGWLHAKLYAFLLSAVFDERSARAETLLSILFGEAGALHYQHYFERNRKLILSSTVLENLHSTYDTSAFLKMCSLMFFDKHQRSLPQSDTQRGQVIQAIPSIFERFDNTHHQSFRSRLVQMTASLSHIEDSISVHESMLQMSSSLLKKTHLINKQRAEMRLTTASDSIEAKLKASLSGKNSMYSASIRQMGVSTSNPIRQLVTSDDVDALIQMTRLLSKREAPETKLQALSTLQLLKTLNVSVQ